MVMIIGPWICPQATGNITIAANSSGSATITGESTTSITVPASSEGDLMVMQLGYFSWPDDFTIDSPSGWTREDDLTHWSSGGTDRRLEFYYKTAGASESNITLRNNSVNERYVVYIGRAYSGFHSSIFDVNPQKSIHTDSDTNLAEPTPDAITTLGNNALVHVQEVLVETNAGSLTAAAPTGYSGLIQVAHGSVELMIASAYKEVASPATETPGAWTATGEADPDTEDWIVSTFALKAA